MLSSYISKVASDNHMAFTYIILALFLFYSLLNFQTVQQKFIIIVFVLLVAGAYLSKTMKNLSGNEKEVHLMKALEKDILKEEMHIHIDNVFGIYKSPKKFKYIYMNTELVETVNKLAFLLTYDKYTYYKLIVCLEYYYKIYYFILLQKYTCTSHYQTLQDLRKEILNLMQQMILNIPEYSKLYDGNLNAQLDYHSKKIQAMTFRCLKILSHKCNKANKNMALMYKSPLAFDRSQEKWQLY